MRKMNGMAVSEIALQLGISIKTAEHHITEALKTIKKKLTQDNTRLLLFFLLSRKNYR